MATTRHVLKEGDRMPELTLPGVAGQSIRLHEYAGKRLFIFMWASW
jgi:peroxiredoxin